MSTETWPRATPPDPASAAADQWVAVGPAVSLNGAPAGHPRVCGTITCLRVSDDGQRIYAGTTLGGLWYSGDAGQRWRALDFYASVKDGSGNLIHTDTAPVGALAVRFGTEATDLVVAGPGVRPPVGRQTPASAVARGIGLRVATGPASKVAAGGVAGADPWLAEATGETGLAVAALAFDRVTADAVWAATNKGLYKRQAGGGTWTKLDPGLGTGPLTGVVVVPGLGAEPERVYVAAADGHVARTADGTTWQAVALPAHPAAAAAVPFERLVLAAGNVPGHAVVWVLAGGPRLWRIDGDTAEIVTGLPAGLLTPNGTSAMALAAHPQTDQAHLDMIAIGGGALIFPAGTLQAHLYLGQVTRVAGTLTFPQTPGPAGQPVTEWSGAGVPAGIYALAFAPGPVPIQLWAGTGAGGFRSANAGAAGSFAARLTGLATAELNSLAVHPFSDGVLYAGARDLGVLRRVSAETWQVSRYGAAGGVGVDPADPRRVYAQSSQAQWNLSADGGVTFADLGYQTPVPAGAGVPVIAAWSAAQSDETNKSALTSRITLTTGPRGTQVALGTDRIYYADDAALAAAAGGRSGWVTLPSATDPYDVAKAAPDRAQDQLDGPVLVPRWADPDHLYVLTRTSVYSFTRAAGTWTRAQLYDQVQVHRNWKGKVPSGQIPDDTPLLELAVHKITAGKANLYAGTAGPASEDHLWWYDGTSGWHETGLPTDAAVHAVAVDPDHPDVVYAGTDIGVWKGTGTFTGGTPSWTWVHYSDGLPEAPCADLAVFERQGGTRLLRGAFAGRGVFEVALDSLTQGPEVYLRADATTARRGPVSNGGSRDPQSPVRAQARLDASPDIRIWRTPAASPVQPIALPVGAGSAPFDIFVLQSALRAAGEDVPADGIWSPQVAAALAHRAGVLGLAGGAAPQQVWNAVVAGSPLPYDVSPPDAADLAGHLREEPDRWPKTYLASCANGGDTVATTVTARIQVVVHARHWHPIPATRISVALLKTRYGGRPNLSNTAPLPPGWAAAMAADRAAPPGGAWLAGQPWSYVDAGNPFRAVPAPADPANPQVVTFDADLTADAFDWPGWLLLAVVVADDDLVAAAETNLAKLVRTDRHVAARSVRHASLPAEQPSRYPAMDVGSYPGKATMVAAWKQSNLQVTGMYLDSPATVPGQAPDTKAVNGHNRGGGIGANPVGAWMAGWRDLYPQWGILTIYWGQQDPANAQGPVSLNQPADIPSLNAADAAAKAAAASIPVGAVIYLDWEVGGAPSADGVTYCTKFFHSLAERGYRPGVYAHPPSSRVLKQNCPGLYIWNVNLFTAPAASDLKVVNHQLLVRPLAMAAAGEHGGPDPDALARQYEFGVAVAGNPVAGFPQIDLDVAIAGDPGYPERRNQPLEIRSGHAAATSDPAGLGVYAIRRGKPVRATWAFRAGASDPSLNVTNAPYLWNPYSAITAVRTAAPADVLLAFGFDTSGPADDWRVQAIRREAGTTTWQQLTVPHGDIAIDPLPGIAASTRGDESIEAFVVDMDAGAPAAARFDPATRSWSTLDTVPGAGAAPARRTNRMSVVSRTAGRLDLFWAGTDNLIHSSSSAVPGTWSAPIQIGDPAVHPHPMTNLCAVSRAADRIDVLFVGRRDGDPAWRLYDVWWDGGGAGWGAPPNTQIVGGAALDIEPLSPIAACARTADHVDAFVVAATGELLISTYDRATNTWSALTAVGGQPVFGGQPLRVSSIDSAVFRGGAEVGVVVTSRDQTVWATHFDPAIPGWTQLDRVVPLDPA